MGSKETTAFTVICSTGGACTGQTLCACSKVTLLSSFFKIWRTSAALIWNLRAQKKSGLPYGVQCYWIFRVYLAMSAHIPETTDGSILNDICVPNHVCNKPPREVTFRRKLWLDDHTNFSIVLEPLKFFIYLRFILLQFWLKVIAQKPHLPVVWRWKPVTHLLKYISWKNKF